MVTREARIETDRPERYLAQICKHATAMGSGGHRARMHGGGHQDAQQLDVDAEYSSDRGTVTFTPGGRCSLTADGTSLTLRIDAIDDDSLGRIQNILTRDLDRFGRRDRLIVNWRQIEREDDPECP